MILTTWIKLLRLDLYSNVPLLDLKMIFKLEWTFSSLAMHLYSMKNKNSIKWQLVGLLQQKHRDSSYTSTYIVAASTMRFNIQLNGNILKRRRRQNEEERQWNRLEWETHTFILGDTWWGGEWHELNSKKSRILWALARGMIHDFLPLSLSFALSLFCQSRFANLRICWIYKPRRVVCGVLISRAGFLLIL